MRIESLMSGGTSRPIVHRDTPMRDVIYEMTSKALGMICVVDEADALIGIITDGDLRRHMDKTSDIRQLTAEAVMTRDPVTVPPTMLAVEALNIMEGRKITSLVVVEEPGKRIAGVVHLHDLWRTEMI